MRRQTRTLKEAFGISDDKSHRPLKTARVTADPKVVLHGDLFKDSVTDELVTGVLATPLLQPYASERFHAANKNFGRRLHSVHTCHMDVHHPQSDVVPIAAEWARCVIDPLLASTLTFSFLIQGGANEAGDCTRFSLVVDVWEQLSGQ